ncbi:MAG: class I SAM-dependent methyltransferase [Candidatus Binataceae bacterium]
MYRCDACRTSFVSPTPSDDVLSEFYRKFHLSLEEGGEYEIVESRMSADFPVKVRLVENLFPEGSGRRLLDVGCGKGFFVKHCRDIGIDAQGVDLSRSAIKFAVDTLQVPAKAGTLSQMKGELGVFDAITFWATIEHVPDPLKTLRDIYSVLRPGGRLFLDTGVGDDWLDRILPGHVQWYDPPQHLFVFSTTGMSRALEQVGFRVIDVDTNFERSNTRRLIKTIRNASCAIGLRLVSSGAGLKTGPFAFTRFQLGNLMSIVAERP